MKKIVFLITVFAALQSFEAYCQANSTTSANNATVNVTKNPPADAAAILETAQKKLDVPVDTSNPISGVANILDRAQEVSQTLKTRNALVESLTGGKQTSLMFDDDEKDNVNRAVDSFKSGQQFISEDGETNNTAEKKIADEKALQDKAKQQEENAKSYIYLASILYTNPKNWAVWVSNNKITSEDNDVKKELYVKSVNEQEVKLRWTISISKWKILSGKSDEKKAPKINQNNQVEINFTLKPNQTFVLNANQVVEGRASPLKASEKPAVSAVNKSASSTLKNNPAAETSSSSTSVTPQ